MLKEGKFTDNYESHSLISKTPVRILSSPQPVFVLCDKCLWCATCFDKTRIPIGNTCPQCNVNNNNNQNNNLSSFPIMSNES